MEPRGVPGALPRRPLPSPAPSSCPAPCRACPEPTEGPDSARTRPRGSPSCVPDATVLVPQTGMPGTKPQAGATDAGGAAFIILCGCPGPAFHAVVTLGSKWARKRRGGFRSVCWEGGNCEASHKTP